MLARHGAGRVEAISPFPPVVQRLLGPVFEVRHEQILVTEHVGDIEAAFPPDENRVARHVGGGRAQTFLLEGVSHLLRRAAEQIERPQQLDVGVADRADRGEGAVGILRHRMAHRVSLETDASEFLGSAEGSAVWGE